MPDSHDYEERHLRPRPAAWSGVWYDAEHAISGNSRFENLMDSQERDRLYRKGLEAFNSGHFYEAHEHWEEVWLKTLNPEKMFLQGLIQVAAAFHHHSRANLQGTRNLLLAGLLKLDQFPEDHGELEIENLRAAVRGWLATIEDGDTCDAKKPPRIKRRAVPRVRSTDA